MHPRRIAWSLGLALVLTAAGTAPLRAQDCDYLIQRASWSPHPSPDSIYINFVPNVVGPVSSDPLNPTQYDLAIAIRWNGSPLEPDHALTLKWWQKIGCPSDCPHTVCEEKQWDYKSVLIYDRSYCTLDAQGQCGCPTLGDPVPHQKAVRKPPGPGLIEIEIVGLNLTSCNPIKPENDKVQFYYPYTGGEAPAASPGGVALLVGALAILGWVGLRRWSFGGSEPGTPA
jgi:hypothetical protein